MSAHTHGAHQHGPHHHHNDHDHQNHGDENSHESGVAAGAPRFSLIRLSVFARVAWGVVVLAIIWAVFLAILAHGPQS